MEMNAVSQLGLVVQREWGQNITTEVESVTGPDHCPKVTVVITLPTLEKYRATASNKKLAKVRAAKTALKELTEQGIY